MSIINAVNHSEFALVAVDTEASVAGTARASASKMLTLPHVSGVIAFRGCLLFLGTAHMQLSAMPAESFDDILDAAEDTMKIAFAVNAKQKAVSDYAAEIWQGAEMLLCGYSDRAGRMVIRMLRSYDGGETIHVDEDAARVICPGDLGVESADIEPTREGLAVLAIRQVEAINASTPSAPGGGRLILAEVRRNSIKIETVGTLGNAG